MNKVRITGTYPQGHMNVMELVPEQVLFYINEYSLLEDADHNTVTTDSIEELRNAFLNKGYIKLGIGNLAVYKHDSGYWLIHLHP